MIAAVAHAEDSGIQVQPCDPQKVDNICMTSPFDVCDEVLRVCVHKGIFPVEPSEIAGLILLPILLSIATVGGVGGGTIMVPVLIGMFGFTTKDAIPISSAIVFWSAFLRFVLVSAYAPHPLRSHATQVDYNVVKTVFPVYLVGSYFGVILSVSLGELILVILMMTVLFVLSVQVLLKAISLFRKETIELKKAEGDFVAAEGGVAAKAEDEKKPDALNQSTSSVNTEGLADSATSALLGGDNVNE